MTQSMTGFATKRDQYSGFVWSWDIRSVNGKGLDLRLRVPDWVDGLEAALRLALGKCFARGSISVTLKLMREAGDEMALRLNPAALRSALVMLAEVEAQAMSSGVTLAQASQADVLALRGVLEQGGSIDEDSKPLAAALIADFDGLLADLKAMRIKEGAALHRIIADQVAQIDSLIAQGKGAAAARGDTLALNLRENLKKVLQSSDGVDENRIAQELALIAVKSDITEELDRLQAHGTAAKALLADANPVGRKLDFLMQEFMREANTLCSKAQDIALTQIGLDLKTVIDQMREQVQNVE